MAKKSLRNIPFIFFAIVGTLATVVAIFFLKSFFREPAYLYTKVKVSQGLWWASTSKPNLWMAKSVNVGDSEENLLGQKIAEVVEVRYYPYFAFFSENNPYDDKYDIYITAKIAVSQSGSTKKALFKRSAVGVGSPITFEFPDTQVTGTVIALSDIPFDDEYTDKTIYLTKRLAYPWEYDAIKIGETYFDGKEMVFKILGKTQTPTAAISADAYGNFTAQTLDQRRYLTVRASVKLKVKGEELFFGEEKQIKAGSLFAVVTPGYTFEEFLVSRLE